MADFVRLKFTQAQQHQQSGEYDSAEKIYREILAEQPEHIDAMAFLGVTAMQLKRYTEAERLLCQAIRAAPDCTAFHCNLGLVYREMNRLEDAVGSFEEALRWKPDNTIALNNLGVTELDLGLIEQATRTLELARQLASDDPTVYVNLGRSLLAQKRFDPAMKQFQKAISLDWNMADAHDGLGSAYRELNRQEEAVQQFQLAISMSPGHLTAHVHLGAIMTGLKRYDEAEVILRRALDIDARHAVCMNNLGIAIMEQGRIEESENWFLKALEIKPDYASARSNLGAIYLLLGRVDESLQTLEDALRMQPDIVDARWNRSLALLLMGDFQGGWLEYEWRWRKFGEPQRRFPCPRWDGSSLAGKTILLHAEQGLGDTIQFVRYAAEIKRQGGRVVLACQAPLVPLLSHSEVCDAVVSREDTLHGQPPLDFHAPLMSLPTIMRTTLSSIPQDIPYVIADEQRVEFWNQRLREFKGRKIAIAWQGSPTYKTDQFRSVPFRHFARLAKTLPHIKFISLQKQHVDDSTRRQLNEAGVLHFDDLDGDGGAFVDSAAILKNVDLTISSDTSIPHLAGALGVRVWLLLSPVPDWRWFLSGIESPWYPTMRVFRAAQRGRWDDVFDQIETQLLTS